MLENSNFILILRKMPHFGILFIDNLDKKIGAIYVNSMVRKIFELFGRDVKSALRDAISNAIIFKKIEVFVTAVLYRYICSVTDLLSHAYENSVFMNKLECAIRNSWCIRSR